MENTAYLVSELTRIGWPCWNNKYSNTVFFKRPDATRTDNPEYSLSGTKVASGMKPGVVVTTGNKRIVK